MKLHKWSELRERKFSPEQRAASDKWVQEQLLEMDLRGIRELTGKTQQELAMAAEMTQGEVSRAEARKDHRLSTLQRIVEALGGELEVIARFDDKTIRLRGV
jgi:hypothetical protein